MCGICGIISSDRQAVEPAIRRMMQAMVHRGPDDEGYEELPLGESEAGPVAGFGFRRLSILDLSPTGHQPMFNSRTGDCLIFNGEIYNFRALRSELQLQGIVFRGTSDSEVLLHALSTWGEAALERLQGMYAFAFYEAKSRRILLARDPLGMKPLYTAQTTSGLLFASEIRALLASRLVPDDLDASGIATMLAYGAPQDPLTVHRAIRSLPAGCCAWIGASAAQAGEHLRSRRHWTFPSTEVEPRHSIEVAAEVGELLKTAVARHLVADRPVGVFLSAGIDSFAITACARQVGKAIDTFTIGFQGPATKDESREAAISAATLGTNHHAIVIREQDVDPLWTRWLTTADRPGIDGFNSFVVSDAVKQAGIVVALSGVGGDELFGGYPHFGTAQRYAAILAAVRLLPHRARRIAVDFLSRGHSDRFREKANELARSDASVPSVALRLRRILTDRQIGALVGEAAIQSLAPHMLPEIAMNDSFPTGRGDAFNHICKLEFMLYMQNTLLRDADNTSMANSIEVRAPFLDRNIVEFVTRLPGSLKMAYNATKPLLRDALAGITPSHVPHRPKTGFSLPIDRWMHGVLRDSCTAAVEFLADSGALDAVAVREIWQEFISSPAHVHWIQPMGLVSLGSYLQGLKATARNSDA